VTGGTPAVCTRATADLPPGPLGAILRRPTSRSADRDVCRQAQNFSTHAKARASAGCGLLTSWRISACGLEPLSQSRMVAVDRYLPGAADGGSAGTADIVQSLVEAASRPIAAGRLPSKRSLVASQRRCQDDSKHITGAVRRSRWHGQFKHRRFKAKLSALRARSRLLLEPESGRELLQQHW
jgi:hypothetical protein